MPISAVAQLAGTGGIAGTVTDSTGAVIPNAKVTATSVATSVSTTRTTTSAGDYNITPLIPGTYKVTVSAQGFETFVQENIVVNALATVALDTKLTVGAASQTVTVTTAPPQIDTTDAALGAVMDNQMYSSLPLQMGQGGNADQRRATDFAYLMPGVSNNNYVGSNNSTDASPSVNGGNPAGDVSEIYIDGINLPEGDGVGDVRFTWTAIGVDAIEQFQVQTAGYSAQYAGLGVQNYSIKSGTNKYHGEIYEYLRNTVLDAWPYFSKVPTVVGVVPSGGSCTYASARSSYCAPGGVKPTEIQNEFGIVLSGPIIRNKLFLFYNYGQYREQAGPKPAAQNFPTYAMLGYNTSGAALGYADYSGYAAATGYNIYDPATQQPQTGGAGGVGCSSCTRTQFAGNHIPASRFSTASAAINQFMLPYEAIASQTQYANNIVVGYPSGLSNWYQTGRLDYTITPKNQLSLIVAFGRQASTGPNASGAKNQLGPPFNTSQSYTPKTTVDMVKDTWNITPHLVNLLGIAYGRYKSLSVTPDDTSQYAASTLGLANTPAGQATMGFPGISFSGGQDIPSNEAGYSWNQKVNNTYTITDNVLWSLAKHNFTFGGQLTEVQFNYIKNETYSSPLTYTFAAAQTGAFTSGTSILSTSGSSVASYMLGAVNTSSVSVGVPGLGSRWLDPSFWLQDDYKVTNKLTLNLGVRYDVWPSVHEVHNLFTWINPTATNNITGNLGTLEFAGNSVNGASCNCSTPASAYKGNVGPRLGLAYQVDPKTVLHASYGVMYARGDWTSGSQSGSPSTTGLTPSATAPAGVSNAPQFYWDNSTCNNGNADGVPCGWTGSVAAPAPPTGGANLGEFGTTYTSALGSGGTTMYYFDPHYGARTPTYETWSVGFQHELTRDLSLTVNYVGSEGHFISAAKAIGSRNNELPESMAALAGYTTATSTAGPVTPCAGATCTFPLLTNKATSTMLGFAQAAGFTPPNPYTSATYYASNSVYQYYYPYPQFNGVSDQTSFVGNTDYNAMQVTLKQREAHGFDFMMNYTYSKTIDDLGTFRVGDNRRLDRSLSTADQPQNLTLTAVYHLPFGKGKIGSDNVIVRGLASGWQISTIYIYHSGSPIAVTASGCGGSGILNQCMPSIVNGVTGRINGSYGKYTTAAPGSPNYIGNVQYLNPAAFNVNVASCTGCSIGVPVMNASNSGMQTEVGNGAALYVPGNSARVAPLHLWGMNTYNDDIALRRVFDIYKDVKFQFEADVLNITNHVVFASPAAVVNTSGFGTISAQANAPRDVQFSGRLQF